jgi:hypothetical protein
MARPRGKRNEAWWSVKADEVPQEAWRRLQFMAEQNRDMRLDNIMYLSIAANGNVDGSGSYGSETSQYRLLGLKMRKNLSQALIETAASLIACNRTMPAYQTTNGDFTLAYKAEQKARVIHGQMWSLGVFDLGIEAFFDAGHVGSGGTHFFINPDTCVPDVVRVEPNSCFVDLAEGRNPRSLFWVHFVNRDQLKAMYPGNESDIESASGPSSEDYEDYFFREDNSADMVKVVEAWHLPSSQKAKDGKHVVTTNNALLFKEDYTRQRFPFAWYHYSRRRAGFFGQGLVERALPSQIRHWQLQTVIDQCQNNGSNQVYLVEENSNVYAEDITNLPGGQVIYYQGTAPQSVTWSGTPADLVAEQERIWADLLEQEGLSPGTIGGELPQKGLNSARAVRAADDVTSRRHIIPTRAFEAYYLQCAQLISDMNDDCLALDPAYEVSGYARTGRQTFLETSKWADLEIPEGNCKLTVFSMNAQPTTPAAKIEAIGEYTAEGYMSKAQALSLLEFPDVDAWQSLETANQDLVEWQIERLRKGMPELPIANQDLELAKKTANDAYLIAYRTQADADVMLCFENYIAYCDTLVEPPPAEDVPPDAVPPDPGAMPIDPNDPALAGLGMPNTPIPAIAGPAPMGVM